MTLTSDHLRTAFLEFFERNHHQLIADSSLIPKNDPTLLFINSGMAPLKPYFTGDQKPPCTDLFNIQKCIRTNDIADVGDLHHLTFFEMMGSWSIGNYFKDHAVALAYEFLVDVLGFDPGRLYATVYSGNQELGLGPDSESYEAWVRAGIHPDRIIMLGDDNFWGPAGDSGPCGPCTEVFFDMGEEFGPAHTPGEVFETTRRYIEIWNAGVFMQFNKTLGGEFEPLPFTSVDTGCGLERLTMAIEGVSSVYETDLLAPLQDFVRLHLGDSANEVKTYRRLTDHIRSAAFILGEGVVPANEGRGYVLRRLIRKSVALTTSAGVEFPFPEAFKLVFEMFGKSHPSLGEQSEQILATFDAEHSQFDAVISRGLKHLDSVCGTPPFVVNGADTFELAATYGMPIDLVRELVTERGGEVDESGYEAEFARHQEISRNSSEVKHAAPAALWSDLTPTTFAGYSSAEVSGDLLRIAVEGSRVDRAETGTAVEFVASATTLYPEGGGQVGDRGRALTATGEIAITATERNGSGGQIVHGGTVVSGSVETGQSIQMLTDRERRRKTEANHTATHLLHAVLRDVLGDHVHQAGSLVEAEHLRFDFTHPNKVDQDSINQIERLVNEAIRRNIGQETSEVGLQEALDRGAHAMFGEKYGEIVRLVEFPGASLELCGGAHVSRTGDIGLFRIVGQESVGKGTRRISALTGGTAVDYTLDRDSELIAVAGELGTPVGGIRERVAQLLLKPAPVSASTGLDSGSIAAESVEQISDTVGLSVVRVAGASKNLKNEIANAAARVDAIVLGLGDLGATATAVIAVPASLASQFDARVLLNASLSSVGGKGGGGPSVAQGGVPNSGRLDEVISALKSLLRGIE